MSYESFNRPNLWVPRDVRSLLSFSIPPFILLFMSYVMSGRLNVSLFLIPPSHSLFSSSSTLTVLDSCSPFLSIFHPLSLFGNFPCFCVSPEFFFTNFQMPLLDIFQHAPGFPYLSAVFYTLVAHGKAHNSSISLSPYTFFLYPSFQSIFISLPASILLLYLSFPQVSHTMAYSLLPCLSISSPCLPLSHPLPLSL